MIEPVGRSFAIMEALSRRPRGTVAVLADETDLPRPTVVRLLQTLVELGYATRISREAGYRLTDKVLGLAQGIRFVDHLIDVAAPHMSRFTTTLRLAALSRHDQRSRHHHPPFDRGREPDVVRAQRRCSAAARSCRARSAAPGSPSARPRSAAPCCAISA